MKGDLVIKDWTKGIGPSPHLGFADMRNLDIYTLPGIARLNVATAKKSSTTVTALIKWFVRNPMNSAQIWALDDSEKVYKSDDNGLTWSHVSGNAASGSGRGLAIWKDYLFVARATVFDVYGPLSSSPAWTNSFLSFTTDSDFHPMLVSVNDNKLYGGAGKYIFSLDENAAPFDPATAGSYTWNATALDLPPNYRIKSLAEQGNNLMIGTWMGTNIYDFKVADIFPWDRSSPSFFQPIQMAENGVNAMVTVNSILYIVAGISGKIFSCNGVQASLIAQIPEYITNLEGGVFLTPYPGAIMHHKGRIFFGISNATGGNGVWSLLPTSKGNILTYENMISTGTMGATYPVVGALLSTTREVFIIGWRDSSTYGIDMNFGSAYDRYNTYGGYVESPLYNVGTPLVKKQFTQIEFQLAKPLVTGQGVKLKYRTNLTDSFTTIGTYDFATIGGVSSHNTEPAIPDCEFVQIRAELQRGTSATTTSPELLSVTLR
jgi:hypothetical protein